MYFGALSIGADLAGGFLAYKLINESGEPVKLIFKDMKADFFKRAEGDVYFTCDDGDDIHNLVAKIIVSSNRQKLSVTIIATTPQLLGEEPVAKFVLTLSLKNNTSD